MALICADPEIGADIVDKKKLTDENEAKLREALDEFKKRYKAQSETEEKSETVEGWSDWKVRVI